MLDSLVTCDVDASTTGDGQLRAVLWSRATGMVDLGALRDRDSEAQDINYKGAVAGWRLANPQTAVDHAVLWRGRRAYPSFSRSHSTPN